MDMRIGIAGNRALQESFREHESAGNPPVTSAAFPGISDSFAASEAPQPQKKPFIIGHRGASSLAPENTMASFRKAQTLGAEMIELDVHRTKDGALIIMHDDTVDRTTDGQGAVKDLTLREIKALDAGSWFSPDFKGEGVPTFDEVLQWARGKVKIDIEIKNSMQYPGIEKEIISLLKARGMEKNVIITSFDPQCIKNVKKEDSTIKTGVLLHPEPLVTSLKVGTPLGAFAGLAGSLLAGFHPAVTAGLAVAGGIAGFFASKAIGKKLSLKDAQDKDADILLPHWSIVDKQWVKDAHSQGTEIFAYTANKPKLVHKLLDYYGVDGIITDNPERFIENDDSFWPF
ncbi:MAG: glycerophosphodiester phosphodiesterase family protein [Candidatus Eremiobacteraeota bacterium]|nr:glycerophosphodiester phosphodiesterase family protein [Candidatus Eremiobacteraeota bacterium]